MEKCSKGLIVAAVAALSFGLIGCGGGGSSTPGTATGVFTDSKVDGIQYTSGSSSGTTDQNGRFTYQIGSLVTFSIGGITIGSATGAGVISPIDLVDNGTINDTHVLNIVRFLMLLDFDGDASNGITITNDVRMQAKDWAQVDFSSSDIATQLTTIQNDLSSIPGVYLLPESTSAQAHYTSTLRCIDSGAFKGTFSGGDTGYFTAIVDPSTGNIYGLTKSDGLQSADRFSSNAPLSLDQAKTFTSSYGSFGSIFSGSFSLNSVSGSWSNSGVSGTFKGSRLGGALDTKYRFTAAYQGIVDEGHLTFDMDASNNIAGIGYSPILNKEFTVRGRMVNNRLTATSSLGASIMGVLAPETNMLSGTWVNDSDEGTFDSIGCQLN
ncbi:MAG: hypothetical protein IBX43_08570 [Campylobacterales bacterium]|nr:hypothetical protein [Campylobacterales bacterium]